MRKLIGILGPMGRLTDPAGLQKKILGNKNADFLNDPLGFGPKRPVVEQFVTAGAAGDGKRRASGYQSSLMGISKLTG